MTFPTAQYNADCFKKEGGIDQLPSLNILMEKRIATFVPMVSSVCSPVPFYIKQDLVYNKTGSHEGALSFFLIYVFLVFYSGHPLLG